MRYTITFLDQQFKELTAHLFSTTTTEHAAFLLGRLAKTPDGATLLIKQVMPVGSTDIMSASDVHISIRSQAYRRALKLADATGQCFLFAHSHLLTIRDFSSQDDREEAALFRTAYIRIHHEALHASLVFARPETVRARVWLPDGTSSPVERVRVIGRYFKYLYREPITDKPLEFFDRQARAFTSAFQPIIKRLHVGVVGVGGTGSAVCEQLIRLGIGRLTVIDNGLFESSNVNRVYGSSVFDAELAKVNIVARSAAEIGLGAEVRAKKGHLSFRSVVAQLLDCDVVFGCTDDEWGRSILNRLAIWYEIPVFDMGVAIDTDAAGKIVSIQGRVTTLLPGAACLLCRRRISTARIHAESIVATNPAEAAHLKREGYLVNIDEPAPAVICFTTAVASAAVAELLHRLTGFQGQERTSTEVVLFLDQTRIRTNATPPSPDCFCAQTGNWGRGDAKRFLDLNWREE